MSTKQSPGAFNCYKAALPDEPIFVILGRDPAGPATLDKWAHERIILGKNATADDRERLREAINQATEMAEWRTAMIAASVNGVPPWRLPMSFVTDDTRPVCVIEPEQEQDARSVVLGLRQDAAKLRLWIGDRTEATHPRVKALFDIVDSINSRATMLESAGKDYDCDPIMGEPEFIGTSYDAIDPTHIRDAFPPMELISEYQPEARYSIGNHGILTMAEINDRLDKLESYAKAKPPQYWTSVEQSENDEDGTEIKMLSATRVSEFLDYATCYGEFDIDTPNGTKPKYEKMSNPMNDCRREAIYILKRILGLIPENADRPETPELDAFCRAQEQMLPVPHEPKDFTFVGKYADTEVWVSGDLRGINAVRNKLAWTDTSSNLEKDFWAAQRSRAALGADPYTGYNASPESHAVRLLDDVISRLEDERLPAPYDLYRAIHKEGQSGWTYNAIGLGKSDLQRIRNLLARKTSATRNPLEAPYSGDTTVKGDPYKTFARNMTVGGVEVPVDQPTMDTASSDLAHSPEVPSHRFAQFHKGSRYAYAKGLEVNPVHLPVALDEMAKSGWHLVSLFGATESEHVGFVFERRDPPMITMTRGDLPGEPAGDKIRRILEELSARHREDEREDIADKADLASGRGMQP